MYSIAVLEQARQVLAQQHDLPVDEVGPGTHFFIDLDDALDFVEVVMTCEEAFGVEITDTEAQGLETVGALASLITRKRDAGPRPPSPRVPGPPAP